jgi:hypothetical protein
MALVLKDRVQETTTTTGTGTLTLGGAVTGYQAFSAIGNANTTYYTITSTSAEWEVGIGTYTTSGTTLSRDTVLASSNSGSLVNLSAGTKNVFVTYPAGYSIVSANANKNSEFASTTLMLFQQTAAPTGWTKQTTHNDKTLRVVSGSASSGGTSAFTTVFTNQTPTITTSGLSAAATTLTAAQMPSHSHTVYIPGGGGCGGINLSNGSQGACIGFGSTAAGSSNSHSHSISGSATSSAVTLNVQYVDLIIASKD